MTGIDFDDIRAQLAAAVAALDRAKSALGDDYSRTAVSARVDLGHTIRDLLRATRLINNTEQLLKGSDE